MADVKTTETERKALEMQLQVLLLGIDLAKERIKRSIQEFRALQGDPTFAEKSGIAAAIKEIGKQDPEKSEQQ